MEYFDIESFEKDNKNRNDKIIFLDNGTRIRQIDFTEFYVEDYTFENSPIRIRKGYSSKTYILIFYRKYFYDFSIGITKKYDEEGKLIEEIDNDKNYPFKVDDLCKLIKEEYGVDLYVTSQIYKGEKYDIEIGNDVSRIYEKDLKKRCYRVTFHTPYPDDIGTYSRKHIFVDGITGKILYEEEIDMGLWGSDKIPNSKTPFPSKEEYFKNINKATKNSTFNGKNYTEEEWKAFEQEQYEKYKEKKNKKSFGDRLFG